MEINAKLKGQSAKLQFKTQDFRCEEFLVLSF